MLRLLMIVIWQLALDVYARVGFAQPRFIDYRVYIQSAAWRRKRALVLLRDNFTCRECGATEILQVHHVRYDNLGIEPLFDLVTLCRACHKAAHGEKTYDGAC